MPGPAAANPSFNASLNDGHMLMAKMKADNVSANPRLYANDLNSFYPETDAQDNSDVLQLGWVVLGPSLESQGQDPAAPIYLQIWVAEKSNFFDVAQVKRIIDGRGSWDQALR